MSGNALQTTVLQSSFCFRVDLKRYSSGPNTVPRYRYRCDLLLGLITLCVGILWMGSASFAAGDVASESRVKPAVEADHDIEALLVRAEQQISTGRVLSPENNNAMKTWEGVVQRASPVSPGVRKALTDFVTRMQNRAAAEKAAGRIFWVDYVVFADGATKLLTDAGNAPPSPSSQAIRRQPILDEDYTPHGPGASAPSAATGDARSVDAFLTRPTVADLPKVGVGMAETRTPRGNSAATEGSPVSGGSDSKAAQPAPATSQTVLPFAMPAAPSATSGSSRQVQSMAALYLGRGDQMLAIKDISAARKFYMFAANAGSVRAVAALARTHDPAFLAQLGVVGLRSDPALAMDWYRKAAALGDSDAKARLYTLSTEAAGP